MQIASWSICASASLDTSTSELPSLLPCSTCPVSIRGLTRWIVTRLLSWIKKFTPKAPADFVSIITSQKFKATDQSPTLTKLLPPGTYVPVVYCNPDGIWQGEPFTI